MDVLVKQPIIKFIKPCLVSELKKNSVITMSGIKFQICCPGFESSLYKFKHQWYIAKNEVRANFKVQTKHMLKNGQCNHTQSGHRDLKRLNSADETRNISHKAGCKLKIQTAETIAIKIKLSVLIK